MGRKRTVSKRPVQRAENRFRKRMKQYEKYQYQGLDKMPEMDLSKYDLDLEKYKQENVMEDMQVWMLIHKLLITLQNDSNNPKQI